MNSPGGASKTVWFRRSPSFKFRKIVCVLGRSGLCVECVVCLCFSVRLVVCSCVVVPVVIVCIHCSHCWSVELDDNEEELARPTKTYRSDAQRHLLSEPDWATFVL